MLLHSVMPRTLMNTKLQKKQQLQHKQYTSREANNFLSVKNLKKYIVELKIIGYHNINVN